MIVARGLHAFGNCGILAHDDEFVRAGIVAVKAGRDAVPSVVQWIAEGLIDTVSGDDVPLLARLVERAGTVGHG